MDVLYQAVVNTMRDPLNVRDSPDANGRKIGELPRGTTVDVLVEPVEGWAYVRAGSVSGYASTAYLARVEVVRAETAEDGERPADTSGATDRPALEADVEPYTTIRREDGTVIRLAGRWAVLED